MEAHRYHGLTDTEEFTEKDQASLRWALKDASDESINKLLRLAGVGEKGRIRKGGPEEMNRTCGGDSAAIAATVLLVTGIVGGQMQVPLALKIFFVISFFLELAWLQLAVFCIIIFKERGPRTGSCNAFIDIWLLAWPVLLIITFLVAQVHKIKQSRKSFIAIVVFGALLGCLSIAGFAFILPSTEYDCGNTSTRGKALAYIQMATFVVCLAVFGAHHRYVAKLRAQNAYDDRW
eukprot:TRINITY_DN19499_c0_g1_i1.p1 TRINITY_DN19499_c0_g1~~TRINITY_DN19499_c0_g1_i1.p1  ORF type:complete len:234 (+),score=29.29 TRINITY_DN19499_c0_g1_i1:115-816(+)